MKKMAFVDLTNFLHWPAGGMLQYELAILPYLAKEFDIDIWGVSVDGKVNSSICINGKEYPVKVWGNVKTKSKLIPNYWRGLKLSSMSKQFEEYDIVYSHTASCTVALANAIDRSKTVLVHHQHGLSHLKDRAIMSLIQRPFVNKAQYISDLVFVVSDKKSVDDYYKTISSKVKGKYIAIGSPIDLSLFSARKEAKNNSTIKLIYTGRIDSHKDVCTLIEMVKSLESIYSDYNLKIVGDGEERKKVEELIKKYGIENKVDLKGIQPREIVLKELLTSDIYVTASIGEGVSISVLEAYASGLPVVCFAVPGLSKQVVDNVTGKVVPARNTLLMAKAIVEIKKNLPKYRLNALKEVEKYSAQKISREIVDTINQIIY